MGFPAEFPHLITMSPERSLSSSWSESGHRVTVVDALSSHSQLAEENISLPQAADSEVKARTPVPEDSQRTAPPPVYCIETGCMHFKAGIFMARAGYHTCPIEVFVGE